MAKDSVFPEGVEVFVAHGKYQGGSRFILAVTEANKEGIRYFDGMKDKSRDDLNTEIISTLESDKLREEANTPPDFSAFLNKLPNDHKVVLIEQLLALKPDADPKLLMELMEQRRKIAEANANPDNRKIKRVWYHDPKTGERSRIPVTEVEAYVAKGWKAGRDVDATPDLRWYHRPVSGKPGYVERERISLAQIPAYVGDGYFNGKGSGKTYNPDAEAGTDAEGTQESKHHETGDSTEVESPATPPQAAETSEQASS